MATYAEDRHKFLTARMEPETFAKLNRVAKTTGRSRSEVVRLLINNFADALLPPAFQVDERQREEAGQ
jgi:predicted DNA-binding protein